MTAIEHLTALDLAIDRGTKRLLELQRPDGVWVGELESNVTMTAQHLFWHHYLGLRTPDEDRRIANELMARMRDDGTWSIWFDGPPDLSTSIEAYIVDIVTATRSSSRLAGSAISANVLATAGCCSVAAAIPASSAIRPASSPGCSAW